MKTRVLKIDLNEVDSISDAITSACDSQAVEGFRLATCFTLNSILVLIFQKLP